MGSEATGKRRLLYYKSHPPDITSTKSNYIYRKDDFSVIYISVKILFSREKKKEVSQRCLSIVISTSGILPCALC
jgi:hypothetical protein